MMRSRNVICKFTTQEVVRKVKHLLLLLAVAQRKPSPKRKYTLNTTELARNKFNALFATHDAKDIRAAAEEQKSAFKTVKMEAKKNVKPQQALTRREV
jgi:hypothetical protein